MSRREDVQAVGNFPLKGRRDSLVGFLADAKAVEQLSY